MCVVWLQLVLDAATGMFDYNAIVCLCTFFCSCASVQCMRPGLFRDNVVEQGFDTNN